MKTKVYIGRWRNGERLTVQCYPDTLEVWSIVRDGQGRLVSREIVTLPVQLFDLTVSSYDTSSDFEAHSF